MTAEITAAWITGGCTLVAGLIGGIYRMRSAQAPRRNEPTSAAPGSPRPVVIATPPPAQPTKTTPPTKAQPEERPDELILPLAASAEDYKGLTGVELDARFLADMEFIVKPGDTFLFSDGTEDE